MHVTWIGSPNYTQGRTAKIDTIFLHWIVGTLSAADSTFQNTSIRTSAHYGIEDTKVHQYVRDTDTAWHTGSSSWNARSIGIEHSAAPDRPASAATVETSAKLVADICKRYAIPCNRTHIKKHNEVYATQCPGTLPIDTIISKAAQILKGEEVEMLTINQLNVLMRLYRGTSPNDYQKDSYVGKVTFDEMQDRLRDTSKETLQELQSQARNGTLPVQNFLPVELSSVYVPPTQQGYKPVTVQLYEKE